MSAEYRVYGFPECPWCQKAKALLDKKGIDYDYVDLPTKEERVSFLDGRTVAARTFPRVYALDAGFEIEIGGYSDLEAVEG